MAIAAGARYVLSPLSAEREGCRTPTLSEIHRPPVFVARQSRLFVPPDQGRQL